MDIVQFEHPRLLWLLLGLLPLTAYYVWRCRQGGATLGVSTVEGLRHLPRTLKYYLRHVPFTLRSLALGLLVVALARPQSVQHHATTTTEGIDIVLSLDISGSMLARDFKPDRITAAKEVAARFIADRPGDRIALVVFAGESFTQSPLTTDKAALQNLLARVHSGMIEDGTAIGNGLATAINRLRESQAPSKVVILLTDGVNNRGQIAPLTAAGIARDLDIRVYTIGVGSMGMAPYPVVDVWGNISYQPMKVEIDEAVLEQIAAQTGGRYFRATDKNSLQAIYDEINTLEKARVEVENSTRYDERFTPFALLALGLLLLEFLLKVLWLRRIP